MFWEPSQEAVSEPCPEAGGGGWKEGTEGPAEKREATGSMLSPAPARTRLDLSTLCSGQFKDDNLEGQEMLRCLALVKKLEVYGAYTQV